MATSSSAVVALTEAHRQEQMRRSALVAAVVARYWLAQMDADDPAAIERWLARVVPAIIRARGTSAILAATYGAALRKLEMPLVTDDFRFEPIGEVEAEKIRTSLMVVGPQALKERIERIEQPTYDRSPAIKKLQIEKARRDTATGIVGATTRHVLDGSRETIVENARRDRVATGYIRVTDSDPCYFCAMLASRGPTFVEDSFDYANRRFVGSGNSKTHDNCACSLKPVYNRSTDEYVAKSKEYEEMWKQSGAHFSGKAAINAFRRFYTGGGFETDPWMS